MALVNEINLFVFDPAFVGRVERLFAKDVGSCQEVTAEAARGLSLLTKAGDAAANNVMSTLDATLSSSSDRRHPDEDDEGGLERDG
jgi:cardiolipin synthase